MEKRERQRDPSQTWLSRSHRNFGRALSVFLKLAFEKALLLHCQYDFMVREANKGVLRAHKLALK